MKSEEWFIEQAKKINLIDPSGSEFEFIQRIYNEGRRDQNLADMEAVTHGRTSYCGHIDAIRAAGPGENE
jgi:hypothetical protein